MRALYKTTLVIWSDYNPETMQLWDLVREAEVGDAYCAASRVVRVDDPGNDLDWDGTEFFMDEDDTEEG